MVYATVVNKRKIDFLLDRGLKPVCGYGEAAIFPIDKQYRDAVDRWEIYLLFGVPYADYIPIANYEKI